MRVSRGVTNTRRVKNNRRVVRLESSRRDAAAQVYARAFFDYPSITATWPDPVRRRRYLAWYLGCAIQFGLLYGEVDTTPELAGLAIWLPPGRTDITTRRAIRAGFLLTPVRIGLVQFFRSKKLEDVPMAAHAEIMQQRPHLYLWGLAVDPQHQGQGTGTALLRTGLQRVDAQGMPCYLETHAEKNLAFYQKQGFEVVRSVKVPESELRFWCMLRPAHLRSVNAEPAA